jgi:hypothetical protein
MDRLEFKKKFNLIQNLTLNLYQVVLVNYIIISFPRASVTASYLVPTRQRGNAVSTAPAVLDGMFISFPRASVGMP